jgi:hypothetical protein
LYLIEKKGFYNQIGKDTLLLLSKQLILPWAKKHKCKQQFGFWSAEGLTSTSSSSSGGQSGTGGVSVTSPGQSALSGQLSSVSANSSGATNQTGGQNNPVNHQSCPFCEEYLIWFSFAKEILTQISSKHEIELPDVNFHQVWFIKL